MATVAEALTQAIDLHQAGQLTVAANIYLTILRADPGCADAWHLSGLIAYQTGRLTDAANWIEKAISLRPDLAVYHSNLAAVYKAMGQLEKAAEAARRAIRLDPRSADGYNNLANILSQQGCDAEAVVMYRKALELSPEYAEGYVNLANSLRALDRAQEAIENYRKALRFRLNLVQAHIGLGILLREQGEVDEAEECFRQAVALAPDNPEGWTGLARIYVATARWEEAKNAVAKGLALAAESPPLNFMAARCEEHDGRYQDAIARVERIRRHLSPPEPHAQEACFELGRLYDRAGDVDRAFAMFCEGNHMAMQRNANWFVEKEHALALLQRLMEAFNPNWVASWSAVKLPEENCSPVFLVGFPRSGTTLLDVILDAHPQVDVLEETLAVAGMERIVRALPGGYPDAIAELKEEHIQTLRQAYYAEAARYLEIVPHRIILDKHPLNTSRAGLIHRVFPRAKFVFAVRHPCDVCLSCFMRDFSQRTGAMANFFTPMDIAWFYARTMDLWQQFCAVLPLEYCVVRYEDLVENMQGEARRLLDFLGLEWHEAIDRYSETARRTRKQRTPNFAQIVQPIYRSAQYRWRRYRKHLEEVLPVLQPYVERFGYTLD